MVRSTSCSFKNLGHGLAAVKYTNALIKMLDNHLDTTLENIQPGNPATWMLSSRSWRLLDLVIIKFSSLATVPPMLALLSHLQSLRNKSC